jgi:hypothetical protein
MPRSHVDCLEEVLELLKAAKGFRDDAAFVRASKLVWDIQREVERLEPMKGTVRTSSSIDGTMPKGPSAILMPGRTHRDAPSVVRQ